MSISEISILLPTRDRKELVEKSLASLISKAAHPERLEIMIGIDDDDLNAQTYFNSDEWTNFITQWPVKYRVSSTERYGYTGLFKYVNYLGADSTGEILMFWNDDALMLSDNWDLEVDKDKDYFGVLRMQCVNHPHPFALFPIIPRKWIDLFGTISLVAHSDWWIYNVCKPVNRVKNIAVEVYHDRADLTGNNKDGTFTEQSYALDGKNPNHPHDWSHPDRVKDRKAWQQKLMLYGYPHTP
jgi:hypothetical protein